MCIVCIANNINRNVYMYLNTRIFPTTGYARVLLFMFIRRELEGTDAGCLFQFTYCVNEMISMHIEECQASELRRQRIIAQSPRISRYMQKDNEFWSNPSLGPSLSCAFGVKSRLTVEGRIKLKYLNL